MQLASATFSLFEQLINIIDQLDDSEFIQPITCLSNNTIGKHVRHMVEFYLELQQGYALGEVNYDQRSRSLMLETHTPTVKSEINKIYTFLFSVHEDKLLNLWISLSPNESQLKISSTFYRELAYNIEHMIHHFALIKIAIETNFNQVEIPSDFGIAPATIRFQKSCAQ
jgi:hypothetical protein